MNELQYSCYEREIICNILSSFIYILEMGEKWCAAKLWDLRVTPSPGQTLLLQRKTHEVKPCVCAIKWHLCGVKRKRSSRSCVSFCFPCSSRKSLTGSVSGEMSRMLGIKPGSYMPTVSVGVGNPAMETDVVLTHLFSCRLSNSLFFLLCPVQQIISILSVFSLASCDMLS